MLKIIKNAVKIGGLATMISIGSLAWTNSASAITIKVAHANIPAHAMAKGFEQFKTEVEKESEGRIQVKIYDSGSFGPDPANPEQVAAGVLQMAASSASSMATISDAFYVFDMPFLFDCFAAADKITEGSIGEDIGRSVENMGITGLGYIEVGFRELFTRDRPIKELGDAKGLKIRSTASKVEIDALSAIGMKPTPVDWNEVYTALQQGTVDGVNIDINLGVLNSFQDVNKYVTLSNMIYTPTFVMINTEFYEGLEEEDRQIVNNAVKNMIKYEKELIRGKGNEFGTNNQKYIDMLEEAGVEAIILPPEEIERWKKAVQPMYEKYGPIIGENKLEAIRDANAGACN